MIALARRPSRRCTTVTFEANFVRNWASSIAESPPPTTTRSWSRKKNPSQVAHAETPLPIRRCSLVRPSQRAVAPVETITERAATSWSPTVSVNGEPCVRSTLSTSSVQISVSKRSACLRKSTMSSGPMRPSGKPG